MGSSTLALPPHSPSTTSLANGMEILWKHVPDAPVFSLQTWIRCGSIHEENLLGAGLSHLLEHMLFNGTKKRGSREISEHVQSAGGYINAYTSFDRTVYWIESPPEGLEECIDILADMTLHSTLAEDEFQKELKVIRREMALGDDSPGQVTSKLLFRTAFQQHPLRHPIIGYRQVFDQLSHEDLLSYYRRKYVPNNMFFVAVGNFEEEERFLELVEEHFGSSPRSALPSILLPPEPQQQGQREATQYGSTQHTQLRLAWPGPCATHADTAAMDIAASLLGSGRSSRLYQRIREEMGLVHSIGSSLYSMQDVGLFVVGAQLDPDKREEVETATLEVIDDFLESGPTRDELDKAIKSELSGSLRSLTTTRGVADDLGNSWLMTGGAEFTREYIDQVQQVTEFQVREAAEQYLTPTRLNRVCFAPEESKGAASARARRTEAPTVEKTVLPSGLTVLLQRDTSLPLVTLHSAFRSGLLAEPEGKAGLTRMVAELLTKDTESRSAAEVASAIESVGGDVGSFSGYNSLGASTEVMAPDWELGLEILSQAIQAPTFLSESLEREREGHLAAIRSEKDRPLTEALKLMREKLFPSHPYRFPLNGSTETVESITADDCRAFAESSLSGGNGVIAVYGDIDPEKVVSRLERQFQDWRPSDRAFQSISPAELPEEPARVEAETDKEQAIVIIGFPGCSLMSEDALALELISD
ncbi:MAG: pitrilysin family protein, partial [Verrucomicrobiota bacterium]